MNFARPEFLWLLTLLPVLVLWAIRGRLRRRRGWEALAQRGRAPRDGTWWWLGSVGCLIVAMAQPRWGRLAAALEALDPQEHAQGQAIVVFSDGEDLTDRWGPPLERLRQQELVVHAVAIGDPEKGHPVPSGADNQPLSYHGEPVRSRRS